MEIKIRFNTEKDRADNRLPAWRVLEDGVERLADEVEILTRAFTTQDVLKSGVTKWHLTCIGKTQWSEDGSHCTIVGL